MKIINCEQRSEEWFKCRLGVPTASNFSNIITTTGSPAKPAKKYLYKLAGEFVAGKAEEGYQNAAMLRGIELEAEARNAYSLITDNQVEQVGFCLTEGAHIYGCSPDGFVGSKGLIEIKCPSIAVHVEYLMNKELPYDYFQQVHGQILVTEREWCDFVSYYPGLPPFIHRVFRDDKYSATMASCLNDFCEELQKIIKQIGGK